MKKRADGRWLKFKTIDGKRVAFYSTAETEKQAIKDIDNQMLAYSRKKHEEAHNFKILADKAIEQKELTTGYKNIEGYITALKHMSDFYKKDIEDIRPSSIQKLLDDMANQEYSFSAIHKVKTLFSVIWDYAIIHENILVQNFISSLKIPKSAKKGKVSAPPDFVIETIMDNADRVDFGMWPMCLMCFGFRRGELAALQVKKIDFENDEIMVDNAVEFISNQPHVKGRTKTEASTDTVPMLSFIKPYLEKMCEGLAPDDYLFGGAKPLTVTQIRKRWDKYCDAIGYKFNGHQLRHAYAKLIYEAGIDVKTAQGLLRHADIRMTMNTYTDFSKKMTEKSINKLDNYLSNF